MKTLKELIVAARCRKGAASGITSEGAYWFACEPIIIRRFGGDGIGCSDADRKNLLQLRHYRNGTVSALVNAMAWHQNYATTSRHQLVASVLGCTTVEEVIACLKGRSSDDVLYEDYCEHWLADALSALGLPAAAPSPDEEQEAPEDTTDTSI